MHCLFHKSFFSAFHQARLKIDGQVTCLILIVLNVFSINDAPKGIAAIEAPIELV